MLGLLLPIIYLAFISLGLPDSLLGSAWPVMHSEFGVPLSWSGLPFMIVAAGTVVSSLLSDRLTRALGAGRVTAISVAMTCAAILGTGFARSYLVLCLWAIPYGLGAGGVDAALNNYVALHYASRHMSWLHCMWGLGALTGPLIMGSVLGAGRSWNGGYRIIGVAQLVLTLILAVSLPLWKKSGAPGEEGEKTALPLRRVVALPGVGAVMLAFFCYCAAEQTVSLWASSYLVTARGVEPATAARYGSLFFIGVTAGRAASGFLTLRFADDRMVQIGLGTILAGILLLLLPLGNAFALAGLVIMGLGCAPIYPSLIHAAPAHFGADRSQAVIGVQMASAYVGTTLMPPLFGALAGATDIRLLPWFLLALLAAMTAAHTILCRKTEK